MTDTTSGNQERPRTGRSAAPTSSVRGVTLLGGADETVRGAARFAAGECAAFSRWVDRLSGKHCAAIKELREAGFSFDLDALEAQLRRALADAEPGPAAAVARRLLRLLARRSEGGCLRVDVLT